MKKSKLKKRIKSLEMDLYNVVICPKTIQGIETTVKWEMIYGMANYCLASSRNTISYI
jgi:hypothetical protein